MTRLAALTLLLRRVRMFWRWWSEPFRIKTDIYERTLVRHRAFPYLLRVQALPESVQDQLDRGGLVVLGPGRVHLTQPLTMNQPDTTLVGGHFYGHSIPYALRVDAVEQSDPWGLS